jgi:hypothetical protein
MQKDRCLTHAIRGLTAACGVIAFPGGDTIAFAQETLCTTSITDSNNIFGRLS